MNLVPQTKIYVGNIAYAANEEEIRALFQPYGTIEDLAMATDKETEKFRGFAIVMMPDPSEAERAIAGVDGHRLRGRRLVVNLAVKKKALKPTDERTVRASAGASMPRRVRASAGEGRPRRMSGGRNPRRGR